jgi:hypothetical protein
VKPETPRLVGRAGIFSRKRQTPPKGKSGISQSFPLLTVIKSERARSLVMGQYLNKVAWRVAGACAVESGAADSWKECPTNPPQKQAIPNPTDAELFQS